ncbi:MAG: Asp23/Gls24 family envelope stress response protein [Oscillospiraceae bacterium]|nr:Asp23/Gls24 family envelope stress response protein [Oscillospiraceae bacterium]
MKTRTNTIAGSLKISNEVVIKIAELAAMEVTGVSVKGGHLDTQDNALLVANRLINPIKATLKGESAEIDVSVIVIAGYKAVKVAESIQQSVKTAVQNMTGIAVSKVNVRISGVRLPPAADKSSDFFAEDTEII